MKIWTYRRRFTAAGRAAEVASVAATDGLHSVLTLDGVAVAEDHTPVHGAEAMRNHQLAARLDDGRLLEVEAGYVGWTTVGVAARLDGALVHESHPGRTIAYPRALRSLTAAQSDPGEHWRKNRWAIGVDIALGLLFFAVAKLTDLTTAALVGAAAGLALVVAQRFVRVDITGGLALFGVVTLVLTALYALVFRDDMAVKLRTTVIGLVVAALFLADGAARGRWLGRGMLRYLPYEDIRPGRLSLGLGLVGLLMAGLNWGVARIFPTDVWLAYSTFGDTLLAFGLFFAVLKFARSGPRPA